MLRNRQRRVRGTDRARPNRIAQLLIRSAALQTSSALGTTCRSRRLLLLSSKWLRGTRWRQRNRRLPGRYRARERGRDAPARPARGGAARSGRRASARDLRKRPPRDVLRHGEQRLWFAHPRWRRHDGRRPREAPRQSRAGGVRARLAPDSEEQCFEAEHRWAIERLPGAWGAVAILTSSNPRGCEAY